jgi:hypothetical protein
MEIFVQKPVIEPIGVVMLTLYISAHYGRSLRRIDVDSTDLAMCERVYGGIPTGATDCAAGTTSLEPCDVIRRFHACGNGGGFLIFIQALQRSKIELRKYRNPKRQQHPPLLYTGHGICLL